MSERRKIRQRTKEGDGVELQEGKVARSCLLLHNALPFEALLEYRPTALQPSCPPPPPAPQDTPVYPAPITFTWRREGKKERKKWMLMEKKNNESERERERLE